MFSPMYCDKCNVRATHSVDDIPVAFDDETLAVGVLFFCLHHTRKYEPVFASEGYSVNVYDEKYYDYLHNQNKLVGSEN